MKIRKVIMIIGISILSFNLWGCADTKVKTTKKSETDWKVVKTINVKQPTYFAGFYNMNFGLTVGYNGEVHYTKDKGANWPKANNVSACRFGLFILNNKVAWNCGNLSQVRKSIDGGANWQEVQNFAGPEPDQARHLSFIDENNGWIASENKLGTTKDGGNTWEEIKLPEGIGNIMAINLLKENQGYLFDYNSNLYITNDGGKTWTNKKVVTKALTKLVSDAPNAAIKFFDDKNGILFYYDIKNTAQALRTFDGGDNWKKVSLPALTGDTFSLSSDGKTLCAFTISGQKITLLQEK